MRSTSTRGNDGSTPSSPSGCSARPTGCVSFSARPGSQGWELAAVYDKASNWFTGMEKGFILLKRPVAPSVHLSDDEWCITMNLVR
jgi:hypothetical protein